MLIEQKVVDDLHTNLDAKEMGVSASKTQKLYMMLSSGVYQDKEGSIIRELCSNAQDSHMAAGQTKAFRLEGPKLHDAVVRVIDYGTGLTYEEAEPTILQFLGSTKDDDDEAIGGWGIGAKAPYSYTNSYNVILRKNGYMWNVQCFKDNKGVPRHVIMVEGQTDEPNGVTFEIAVEEEHIDLWRAKIVEYMKWTNYNIESDVPKAALTRGELLHSDPDFDLVIARNVDSAGVWLVYGGYRYSIEKVVDFSTMVMPDGSAPTVRMLSTLTEQFTRGVGAIIQVNRPNAVRCPMSREELEKDPDTVGLVNRAVSILIAGALTRGGQGHGEALRRRLGLAEAKGELPEGVTADNFFGTARSYQDAANRDRLYKTFVDDVSREGDYLAFRHLVNRLYNRMFEFKLPHRLRSYRTAQMMYSTPLEQFTKANVILTWSAKAMSKPDWSRFMNVCNFTIIMYVKAPTQQEAFDHYASMPELEGFDVSCMRMVELEPRRAKADRNRTNAERMNSVFCVKSRKRITFDKAELYVLMPEYFPADVFKKYMVGFKAIHISAQAMRWYEKNQYPECAMHVSEALGLHKDEILPALFSTDKVSEKMDYSIECVANSLSEMLNHTWMGARMKSETLAMVQLANELKHRLYDARVVKASLEDGEHLGKFKDSLRFSADDIKKVSSEMKNAVDSLLKEANNMLKLRNQQFKVARLYNLMLIRSHQGDPEVAKFTKSRKLEQFL